MRTEELNELSHEQRLRVKTNLRRIMRERGVTNMSEIARALDVAPPTVSKWCSDNVAHAPNLANLQRLAAYLETTVGALCGVTGERDAAAADVRGLFEFCDAFNRGADARVAVRRLGLADNEFSRREWERYERNSPFLRLLFESLLGRPWEEATVEEQAQAIQQVLERARVHGVR